MSFDTDILIIGAGMSGVGLAVQLTKKYGNIRYEIVEKSDNIGGTWWVNSYPGCGCDVQSHFYSYSFALNPNWSRKFPLQPEIASYFQSVALEYAVPSHTTFHSVVQKTQWDESSSTWVVTIFDQKTKETYTRRSKVLVSAVGALSVPKQCDVPGADGFKGPLFHSARWDHSFDCGGKEVVVLGNGCSATQFVPVISSSPNAVKKVTQFSRQAHWLAERPNPSFSGFEKWVFRHVPLAMRAYRAWVYYSMESDFSGFYVTSGGRIREGLKKEQSEYIRKLAPERYHEALVPKTEIGCKRKVMDTDYLACLHRDNVELVFSDPVAAIEEDGVRTKSGRHIKADAIILATGFATQQVLFPMDIRGEKGISLVEHWNTTSQGSAQAYYGTCISGFPNFFIMMGPNTTTGHLSVIFSVECQINFTLRVLDPILKSLYPSSSSSSSSSSLSTWLSSSLPLLSATPTKPKPDNVAVKLKAEIAENEWIQTKAKELVWATGCTSWYVDAKTGRNTMMYPVWQYHFWLRSLFISKKDFVYRASAVEGGEEVDVRRRGKRAWSVVISTLAVGMVLGLVRLRRVGGRDWRDVVGMLSRWLQQWSLGRKQTS